MYQLIVINNYEQLQHLDDNFILSKEQILFKNVIIIVQFLYSLIVLNELINKKLILHNN